MLDDDDFIANKAPRTAPPVKHRYMLGGGGISIDAADLVGSSGTFAPFGTLACMCGPRHTVNARGLALRLGQRVLLAAYTEDQASPEMPDEHGSVVGGLVSETALPLRLRSLSHERRSAA